MCDYQSSWINNYHICYCFLFTALVLCSHFFFYSFLDFCANSFWTVNFTNISFFLFTPPLIGQDGYNELELGISLLPCIRLEGFSSPVWKAIADYSWISFPAGQVCSDNFPEGQGTVNKLLLKADFVKKNRVLQSILE